MLKQAQNNLKFELQQKYIIGNNEQNLKINKQNNYLIDANEVLQAHQYLQIMCGQKQSQDETQIMNQIQKVATMKDKNIGQSKKQYINPSGSAYTYIYPPSDNNEGQKQIQDEAQNNKQNATNDDNQRQNQIKDETSKNENNTQTLSEPKYTTYKPYFNTSYYLLKIYQAFSQIDQKSYYHLLQIQPDVYQSPKLNDSIKKSEDLKIGSLTCLNSQKICLVKSHKQKGFR